MSMTMNGWMYFWQLSVKGGSELGDVHSSWIESRGTGRSPPSSPPSVKEQRSPAPLPPPRHHHHRRQWCYPMCHTYTVDNALFKNKHTTTTTTHPSSRLHLPFRQTKPNQGAGTHRSEPEPASPSPPACALPRLALGLQLHSHKVVPRPLLLLRTQLVRHAPRPKHPPPKPLHTAGPPRPLYPSQSASTTDVWCARTPLSPPTFGAEPHFSRERGVAYARSHGAAATAKPAGDEYARACITGLHEHTRTNTLRSHRCRWSIQERCLS